MILRPVAFAEVKWQKGCVGFCSSDQVGGRTQLQVKLSLADNQYIVLESVAGE